MKLKMKISNRERWLLAVSPALLITGFYFLDYMGGLTTELEKAQKRLAAAHAPIAPPGPSASAAKAKATLEATRRNVSDHQAKLRQVQSELDVLASAAALMPDEREPARIIERVEAVFARNGITPVVCETANEGNGAAKVPTELLAALSPKSDAGAAPAGKTTRVWHYIFDDTTPHFENALRDLVADVPGVVPLSLNFVYNPRNYGETRQLELWLLY